MGNRYCSLMLVFISVSADCPVAVANSDSEAQRKIFFVRKHSAQKSFFGGRLAVSSRVSYADREL